MTLSAYLAVLAFPAFAALTVTLILYIRDRGTRPQDRGPLWPRFIAWVALTALPGYLLTRAVLLWAANLGSPCPDPVGLAAGVTLVAFTGIGALGVRHGRLPNWHLWNRIWAQLAIPGGAFILTSWITPTETRLWINIAVVFLSSFLPDLINDEKNTPRPEHTGTAKIDD